MIARTARLVVNLAVALAVMTAALVMGAGTSHAATRAQIASIAEAEVGNSESNGGCKKYGPCTTTPWCAYFASWVWRTAGVSPVPNTAVARGVGLWGQQQGLFSARPAGGIGNPEPGDIAVYGTPANASGGHVSIVTAVHSNGTITTIDGNYGDKVARRVIDPRTARSGNDSLLISGYVKPKGLEPANGDLHVLTTVGGQAFHNMRYANGSWSGANVSDPSGAITDTAEAGASNGDMNVLTVAGGQLFHNLRYANGSWSGVGLADGNGAISKVAAATTPNGDLHVLTLVQGKVFHNVRWANGSWNRLPDPIRLVFRRLGVIGPAQFSPWLLGALLDVSAAKADDYADKLTDAQFVDSVGIGPDGEARYSMHNLIQLFAREQARAEEPPADQRQAVERLGRLLLTTVTGLRARPHPQSLPPAPAGASDDRATASATVPAEASASSSTSWSSSTVDAHAWLDQEQWLLVQTIERACELGLHRLACELSTETAHWFQLRNSVDAWWRTHDAALKAARTAGDQAGEATLLRGLGRLRYKQDRMDDSAEYYRRALELFGDLNDPRGQARCLVGEASVRREQGQFADALSLLERANTICTELDDAAGLAECAYGIGYIHREVGNLDQSRTALETALTAYRRAGDQRGEGTTLRSLAMVHRASGELGEAERLSGEAIAVFEDSGDRLLLAYGLQCLAKVHIRQGRNVKAAALLQEALGVCTALGDRFGVALVTRSIGERHLAAGELSQALAHLTAARDQWTALHLDLFRARTERDLAEAHRRLGDSATAEEFRARALDTFQRFGSREYAELRGPTGPT